MGLSPLVIKVAGVGSIWPQEPDLPPRTTEGEQEQQTQKQFYGQAQSSEMKEACGGQVCQRTSVSANSLGRLKHDFRYNQSTRAC